MTDNAPVSAPGVFAHPDEAVFESLGGGRPAPPNIVFIVADDLGWADLGCYGSTAIRTPNIDRLAEQGMRFTHGYSASPWCSAMRIGLYTGRYPGRIYGGLQEPLTQHTELDGIPPEHPTLPSLLVEAGYETAMFGKWHCGWLPWFSPIKSGFQTFFGNFDGVVDYFEHISSLGDPDLWEGETNVEETGYYTELLSDRAAEFVQIERDRPFYLQLNYTAPHWPWEGPGDAEMGRSLRERQESGEMMPILHFDGGSLAKYGELVEAMDEGIGQVLDALDAAGRTDDTLVIFCSDNGGERWSKNWPFIGMKGDITEGGIRVPFILRWPGVVGERQVCHDPSITMDWTATLLDVAGTAPHPDYPLDGLTLLPWLADGATFPEHDLCWRLSSQSAIRRGSYKYIMSSRPRAFYNNWPLMEGEHEMLYDVTVDGREAADLLPHRREIAAELRAELQRVNADLLEYPPDFSPIPGPARGDQPAVSHPD